MQPDAQLVQDCLRGHGPAWEELVHRHSRRVFNICYRFTGNSTEAEDLSQEVFLKIYRSLASYREISGGFATWLTSVTPPGICHVKSVPTFSDWGKPDSIPVVHVPVCHVPSSA